jgi:hypothetical protein
MMQTGNKTDEAITLGMDTLGVLNAPGVYIHCRYGDV